MSYWVSDCVIVGCTNKTAMQPVCGPCGGWGEDAAIPLDWRVYVSCKPTMRRMRRMLEACFEPGAYEFGDDR